MDITYIYNQTSSSITEYVCLIVKLSAKEIWLFNCVEGCQNYLIRARVKMGQISTIIINDLRLFNLSGLIGLLSSLSLASREKDLYIYAPIGIEKYLLLIKKYSKTNFKYNIFIIFLYNGLISQPIEQIVYLFMNNIHSLSYDCMIINAEEYQQFNIVKACNFQILPGPVYGQLKKCYSFLLPDGLVLNGNELISFKRYGSKSSVLTSKYHTRQQKQIMYQTNAYFINTSLN